MQFEMTEIGTVECTDGFRIRLNADYAAGLTGFSGFTHAKVTWYADKLPEWTDGGLVMPAPYKDAPEKMGVFATRSPFRPNRICVSSAQIVSSDAERGILELAWIDAEHGTPVLDIKPYHPSEDRIRTAQVPSWAASWPACYEESADFPWESVFLF